MDGFYKPRYLVSDASLVSSSSAVRPAAANCRARRALQIHGGVKTNGVELHASCTSARVKLQAPLFRPAPRCTCTSAVRGDLCDVDLGPGDGGWAGAVTSVLLLMSSISRLTLTFDVVWDDR